MKSTIAETFREEAQELLAELEAALLELEGHPTDGELLGRVFRSLHTLKGAGAMAGFDAVSELLHEVESVYELVRGGRIEADRDLIGLTLSARDRVRSMILAAEGAETRNDEFLALKSSFQAMLPPTLHHHVGDGNEWDLPGTGLSLTWRITFRPPPEIFRRGINPLQLLRELGELGDYRIVTRTETVPDLEDLDTELCYLYWEATVTTTEGENAIRDIFIFVEDESELTIERVDDSFAIAPLIQIDAARKGAAAGRHPRPLSGHHPLPELASRPGREPDRTARRPGAAGDKAETVETSTTIRVHAEKLDALVDLVGQLVTVQARLSQLADEKGDADLQAVAEDVERLSGDLRDQVLQVRMVPIGGTFSKFRRLVRDLGEELGKEVELTTEGAETELDKTLIDRLYEPLVHLIRNSIDHGIEAPEVRRRQGKPLPGRIHLAASHSGANVLIRVSDDGAGLDREAIRKRGTELGLVAPNADLSDREVQSLIFNAGLSTARRITSVSGRGIGMDAVRQTIETMRGSIEVDSRPGEGTAFEIRLPLTLAIIDGLLVRVANDSFVLPLSAVEECIELQRETETRTARRLIDVRGEIVPYVRLRERFGVEGLCPAIEQIVIARPEGRRIGIVVDQVVGGHQTVIKPLGAFCREAQDFSGATILGDGRVAMILDLPRIIQGAEECAMAAFA